MLGPAGLDRSMPLRVQRDFLKQFKLILPVQSSPQKISVFA
jgi:hypothetical protein